MSLKTTLEYSTTSPRPYHHYQYWENIYAIYSDPLHNNEPLRDYTHSFPTGNVDEDNWINSHDVLKLVIDDTTTTQSYSMLTFIDVKSSISTIGWFSTKGAKVDMLKLTKLKLPTNRPKLPVRSPPKFFRKAPKKKAPVVLFMIPPSARADEGLPQFQIRLNHWAAAKKRREERLTLVNDIRFHRLKSIYDTDLVRYKQALSIYNDAYEKRLSRYKKALERFNKAVARASRPVYQREKRSKDWVPQDNPYGRITVTPRSEFLFYDSFIYHRQDYGQLLNPDGTPVIFTDNRLYVERYPLTSMKSRSTIGYAFDLLRQEIVSSMNPSILELDSKVRKKLHSKLKGSAAHVGNLIAERHQSFELAVSSFKRILPLLKLKKNLFKGAAGYLKNPKAIANDILAFKFGVEPLINDIKSAIDYIDKTSDDPLIVARSNGGSKFSYPLKVDNSFLSFDGFAEVSYTLKCRIDNPVARALSQFGLINPLEIAWEVLPWSFVIDWFIPVGEWISNQTADCGLVLISGTRKVKYTGDFIIKETPEGSHFSSNLGSTGFGLSGSFYGIVIDRQVLHSLPDVLFPPIKNPWSWSHGVEAVSLAVQKLKRGRFALR